MAEPGGLCNAERGRCLSSSESVARHEEKNVFLKTPFLLMPKETGFWMPKEKHKGESPFDPPRTIIACFGCAQKKQRIAPQTVGTAADTFSCSLPAVRFSPRMTADFPTHAGKKTPLCADTYWTAGFRRGIMTPCGITALHKREKTMFKWADLTVCNTQRATSSGPSGHLPLKGKALDRAPSWLPLEGKALVRALSWLPL